jgi:sugar/nucleoside kinase (ribokinase family)
MKDNIDYRSVNIEPNIDTSINIGLVTEDGERTFVTNRNGSLWRTTIENVDLSRFHEAKLLSLASIFNNPLIDGPALVKIFQAATANNMIICADMIKSRLGEELADISEALSYLDYFFPNYEEACMITGNTDLDGISNVFLGYGVKNVVIKTGKKGCFIKSSKERYVVPAYKNAIAIDTIGAGDNFVAGFITAMLDNLSLEDCGKFANVTASVSVECVGATTGVRNRQQVDSRMKEYLNSY